MYLSKVVLLPCAFSLAKIRTPQRIALFKAPQSGIKMNTIRNGVLQSASRARRSLVRTTLFQDTTRCRSTIEKPPGERAAEKDLQFFIPKGIMGQPTCYTHPHMVPQGHLTCGITQQEYRDRRETLVQKLIAELHNIHRTHIIVIPGAAKLYMSDKIPYVFRQNTDFFYLTGCMEPSAVLVMVKQEQTEHFKTILFVQDKDSHAELWEGPRTGCAAAARLFAVDETYPVEAFHKFINKTVLASKPSILWYHDACPPDPAAHAAVRAALQAAGPGSQRADPQRALHCMRAIKSPAEIELMKETCEIGAQSLNMAMACTKPGVSEASIAAALEYSVRCAGAEHAAFPPVVAGGARATHIHYVSNNQLLGAEEMLLIDTGSQRWLYNSDISRTFPVSGKFSTHHRILYELVLTVQKRLIELLGAHRPPLDQLFDSMCRLLGKHLQQEGILSRGLDGGELINRAYRLCPHHVSHYVGMDVHDTPLVGRRDPVRAGHCVTVEPGIYIRPDDETIPPEFRGIGIRIEDDVLITDGEPLVLTSTAVKEVHDIEAIVGRHAL